MRGLLFICLNALFMSYEQSKRHYLVKKKEIKKKKKRGHGIQTFTMFYTKLDFIKIEFKKKGTFC